MLARRAQGPGRMPMAHALARAARSLRVTLRKGKERDDAPETTHQVVSGDYAKGVRAKFRHGVARSEQMVVLNFDLTPIAS
jgi:hypothetical protein